MRSCLAVALLALLSLPQVVLPQGGAGESPTGRPHPLADFRRKTQAVWNNPGRASRRKGQPIFTSKAQKLLLQYRDFGKKVESFVVSWNEWKQYQNIIAQNPDYDRDLLRTEEELWKDLRKRMNKLLKTRQSKNFLLAAEELEEKKAK